MPPTTHQFLALFQCYFLPRPAAQFSWAARPDFSIFLYRRSCLAYNATFLMCTMLCCSGRQIPSNNYRVQFLRSWLIQSSLKPLNLPILHWEPLNPNSLLCFESRSKATNSGRPRICHQPWQSSAAPTTSQYCFPHGFCMKPPTSPWCLYQTSYSCSANRAAPSWLQNLS